MLGVLCVTCILIFQHLYNQCVFPHMCTSVFRVDRNKYQIQIPLPPKIDPSVTMMTVEEKPDVTYADLGGVNEQIEKIREVVELPLLHVLFYTAHVRKDCVCRAIFSIQNFF